MTENTITPQDTERQEGVVPRPDKFTKTLFELSEYFDENMRHHKNNLYLFGYTTLYGCIFELWNNDLARSMSDALEKIMIDTADAIEDFSKKLESVYHVYKEHEKGGSEAIEETATKAKGTFSDPKLWGYIAQIHIDGHDPADILVAWLKEHNPEFLEGDTEEEKADSCGRSNATKILSEEIENPLQEATNGG
jgi:hypothetical protein